ncbi:MAG TPA: dUTPase [Firmicutes bacterium]|jgi:dimeric dUTPase (all-alpha-NTP-PPase superfamily)|nr:dUTPase [Bacillota bacterium]
MQEDMLREIFRLQESFDRAVVEHRDLKFSQEEWIQKEVLAIISELSEILSEVNFKWWKDPKEVDRERLLEEIVDVLHFFVSMCLKASIGPEELYQAYVRKNRENFARQQGLTDREGYAWKK